LPYQRIGLVCEASLRPVDLDVGHRGCGVTRTTVFSENSLLSFCVAAKYGAPFVEFDIQMTKDEVPVIHHDFVTTCSNENGIKVEVPISSLSLKQFQILFPARFDSQILLSS